MRQTKVKKFGYYLWKDIDAEKAMNQVKFDESKFDTEQEFANYLSDLLAIKFEEGTPLWEIRQLRGFDPDTSIIVIKCHHSLTDGLGMISLVSCLDDEQFSMRSPFKNFQPSLLQTLALPFLVICTLVRNLFDTNNINTDHISAKF